MKAMILAAGLGTRLLPYTLKRAKPLFPVLNKPLLLLTISRLKEAGFHEIIVNAHHLQLQVEKTLQAETGIILQNEKMILGTGGGLRLALPHFGADPVLVVNGDIYHSIDYREVYNSHCASGANVTLVLHDYPRFNDVAVDGGLRITGFSGNGTGGERERLLAFTGIHVIDPAVLRPLPLDTASCIIDCYRELLRRGGSIRAYLAARHFWTDMGTPEDYLKLHANLLHRQVPVYRELAGTVASAPFVGVEDARLGPDVKLLDWVCLGKGVLVESGATLARSVVWDDAVVPAGSVMKDTIVTP